MKRTLVLVVVAAVMGALAVAGRTQAEGIFPGGLTGTGPVATAVCVSLPKQTPCPAIGPETITELLPVKSMSVSGATPGPVGVDSYGIGIVSQIGCFSLTEPVLVSALGNRGEAVLRQVSPPQVGGNPYLVNVVPSSSGTATLSLEVWTRDVGPAGLTLKAIWPEEGVERLQTVYAQTPQPTPTGAPATLTPTQGSSTATTTPVATNTPAPTVTATPTPLTLATCYSSATSAIDIRSLPGATCTLSLTLNHGLATNTTYSQGPFAIPSSGVGEVPFIPAAGSSSGTAVTTCSSGGQTQTSTLTFTIPIPTTTATATP